MAFWDKITEVTKNVTDKTNDLLEIGRLNSRIAATRKKIDEKVLAIGDYYLNLFDQGIIPADELQEAYFDINQLREEIAALQDQVNELKGVSADAANTVTCSDCGTVLQSGAKFCASCGKRIEE